MGRYDLSAQRVHTTASRLLHAKRIASPPPWYSVVGAIPPSARLDRPVLQRPQKPGKKASRLFKPIRLKYEEDRLRWEYFNDHPWELARPRVMVENDGRDTENWDWSVPLDHSLHRPLAGSMNEEGVRLDEAWDRIERSVARRPINGEAVVQRQGFLISTGIPTATAYDTARKEFYRLRHAQEIETRVAREEALNVGAFFGPGPLEIGMIVEDEQYEDWRRWAEKEIQSLKQLQGSAYTGSEAEGGGVDGIQEPDQQELQEVSDSIPASREGQEAKGGAALHP